MTLGLRSQLLGRILGRRISHRLPPGCCVSRLRIGRCRRASGTGNHLTTDAAVATRVVVAHLAHARKVHVALGSESTTIGTRDELPLNLSAVHRAVCRPALIGAAAAIPQPSARRRRRAASPQLDHSARPPLVVEGYLVARQKSASLAATQFFPWAGAA